MKEFRYSGQNLREISFPVGGIGAGCIGLAGNAALIDWEIRNHPDKGVRNSMTHFAVKAESSTRRIDARVLQGDYPGRLSGDYEGNVWQWHGFGYGVPQSSMAGFPHFENCAFFGNFPCARVELTDEHFPGTVALTAFSSFAPLQTEDSSLPCAFYEVTFHNPTQENIRYTAACTLAPLMENAVSVSESGAGRHLFGFHGGENSLCVATDCADTHIQQAWHRGEWFEGASLYWRDFSRTQPGFLPDRRYQPDGSEKGTVEARISLHPGETGCIRFALCWYFPICENTWEPARGAETPERLRWRNHYATRFVSAENVAYFALENWARLRAQTFAFRDALYSCSMPDAALDAAGACLSVLVTPVCMRLEDGSFYGWEGANEHGGSCEGTCQHVWNYAYALPFLFPDLERSIRELEARYSQFPDGRLAFRLKLPPGREAGWPMPCVDGQFGYVMKVYHHWKLTGDTDWMRKMWPSVRAAVEFAWQDSDVRWDPQRTGILSGRQHHTLDREFFGPSSWLEGFYLGALDAARHMAEALSENSQEFALVYEKGRKYLNETLFNGEYYSQNIDLKDKRLLEGYPSMVNPDFPRVTTPWTIDRYWNEEYGEIQYQLGDGCLLDQALAQWHMNLMGLGRAFDREKLRSALESVYRNNFKQTMRNEFNPCRLFCLDGESGTMICTYPPGHPMQAVPIPYCQEVMTGFEYAAAELMLMEDLQSQAEDILAAVRRRYDGSNRNPWNEIECGSNYARSMSAFALTAVYSGFCCDMTRGRLAFSPVFPADKAFHGVWFSANAWGRMDASAARFDLMLESGVLRLRCLYIRDFSPVSILSDGNPVEFSIVHCEITFSEEISIRTNLVLYA